MKNLSHIFIASCFLLSFACKGFSGAAASAPNVVLILIDDLSHYGVSAYGAEKLKSLEGFFEATEVSTPNIDRLADEGVLFEEAYARPICEPTRVAMMSGVNNRRNFVNAKALHASQITFGDLFDRAGYRTGIFGKWKQSRGTQKIKGENYVEAFGWDEVFCYDLKYEGPRHIDPNFVINGEIIWYSGINPDTGRRYYGPRMVNEAAIDFIDSNKDAPFFLYYSMLLVHDEHTPTPDTLPTTHYDTFEVMKDSTQVAGIPYGSFAGDDRRYFPDMVAYTDKMIGKLVDKLDALGLRENTLILLVGDNGTKNCFSYVLPDGSEYSGGKGKLKRSGQQVPLIASMPEQIPQGARYDGLTDIMDILPTICEAATVPIPSYYHLDGISFWDQLNGSTSQSHRDSVYVWYNANRGWDSSDKILAYARDARYKLYAPNTRYPKGRLFDLKMDPTEIAGNKEYKFSWNDWLYAGLDLERLTGAEQKAYDKLSKVLSTHSYKPVSSLKIESPSGNASVGESLQLGYRLLPADATVKNVIWESSDPQVASIDKFGVVTCHSAGKANISIFSWDDAAPRSNPNVKEFSREGVTDSIELSIKR